MVLASASPRRHALLAELLGADGFTIADAAVDEAAIAARFMDPRAVATALARAKAAAVVRPGSVLIGADTVVVDGGDILGKPVDRDEARATLRRMRGRHLDVITAVCVIGPRGARSDESVVTRLLVGHPSDEVIDAYVATGEADDKAGSLAVQGRARAFIDDIDGCLTNVYGLPLCATGRLLAQARVPVAGACPDCGDGG